MRCWDRAALDLPAGLVRDRRAPTAPARPRWWRPSCSACLGVSPRTAREAEIVRHGAEALHVTLELDGPGGAHRREIGFAPGRGRRLRLDGEPVRSLAAVARPRRAGVHARRAARGEGPARRPPARAGPGARGQRPRLRRGPRGLPAGPRPAQRAAAPGPRGGRERGHPAGVGGAHGRSWAPGSPRPGGRASPPWPARSRPGSGSWAGAPAASCAWRPRRRASARWPTTLLEEALARTFAERRPREIQAAQTLSGPHRDDLWIGAARGGPAPGGQPGRAAHRGARAAAGGPRPPARPLGAPHPAAGRRAQRAGPDPPPACCWRPCATVGRPW